MSKAKEESMEIKKEHFRDAGWVEKDEWGTVDERGLPLSGVGSGLSAIRGIATSSTTGTTGSTLWMGSLPSATIDPPRTNVPSYVPEKLFAELLRQSFNEANSGEDSMLAFTHALLSRLYVVWDGNNFNIVFKED